jgi:Cu(I)/Ag(I) efflux system membrane fusion protein
MRQFLACFMVLFLVSCSYQNEKQQVESTTKQQAFLKTTNSNAFNESFKSLLNAYFNLKDQFIAEKDSGVNQSARLLKLASDSLQLTQLQGDSNLINTAKTYTEGISAEIQGLLGEKDFSAKQRSFQMVSDQLYDLIRIVQYNQMVLFHYFCPSSFDDQGAYWISQIPDGKNPYSPKLKTPCAEIRDTISFSSSQ